MNLATLVGGCISESNMFQVLSTNMPWSKHKSVPASSKMSNAIYNDKFNHCCKTNLEKHI